jgi:hypothetical protein
MLPSQNMSYDLLAISCPSSVPASASSDHTCSQKRASMFQIRRDDFLSSGFTQLVDLTIEIKSAIPLSRRHNTNNSHLNHI